MEVESLKKLKSIVEKNLDELANKTDLSPAETKTALDGFKLREWIRCEIEECRMDEEYSERNYSRRGYSGEYINPPYRKYDITAYSRPEWRDEHSMMRSYGMPDRYNNGYSRHSIGDRVIEKMENLMDQAESEYEREELRRFMKMIRQAAD